MKVHELVYALTRNTTDMEKDLVIMIPGDGEDTRDVVFNITGFERGTDAIYLDYQGEYT